MHCSRLQQISVWFQLVAQSLQLSVATLGRKSDDEQEGCLG